jgi:hypothetical protein
MMAYTEGVAGALIALINCIYSGVLEDLLEKGKTTTVDP